MRAGEALPVVGEDATLKDVVVEMTAKGLGMTTVVDRDRRLVGVITDGDLRRLLLRGAVPEGLTAGSAATRAPQCIGGDELAAKALEVMEGRITSLVVVDEAQRPCGVIHLHDILRAKIV
jgi:arabinose-5-phosphate isomerase